MDSHRRVALLKNRRGVTLVLIALMIVVILGFLGLAVDIGYMYVATGQLQNAADSGALAGASQLPNTAMAVSQAENITETNLVVPGPATKVAVSSGDISLGNWNRKNSPSFTPGGAPVNAVRVVARRTDGSEGGPVELFFSKIIGWPRAGTWAEGIAARTPRAGFYFTIGSGVCNSTSFPVKLSPGTGFENMAWTSYQQKPTSASDVRDDYICPADKVPDVEVCGESLYTTNGDLSSVFQGVETDFYDPSYDRTNKTFDMDGAVTTWTVIVPVTTAVNPTTQPLPQPVWGYARIRIIMACGPGNGTPCLSPYTSPPGVCDPNERGIFIDQITCVSCEESSSILGARPHLVQ